MHDPNTTPEAKLEDYDCEAFDLYAEKLLRADRLLLPRPHGGARRWAALQEKRAAEASAKESHLRLVVSNERPNSPGFPDSSDVNGDEPKGAA